MHKLLTRVLIPCIPPLLAGSNFTPYTLQVGLEGGLATGFEKLIMDADRLRWISKSTGWVWIWTEDQFARDAYQEVEPGGHFLGSRIIRCVTTRQHSMMRSLSDSDNVETWEEKGWSKICVNALLISGMQDACDNYETPPMD